VAIAAAVAEFVSLRRQWSSAIVEAAKNRNAERASEVVRLMNATDRAAARVERISIRASMDHRPRALSERWPATALRDLFAGGRFQCIRPPAVGGRTPAPAGNPADSPARADAAGCEAQRLFMSRRYAALESLIANAESSLADLPGGNSSLGGVVAGLNNLIESGGFDVKDLLGRTADWRRAVPRSFHADLVEALVFEIWGWSARGHGTANDVSPQAWVLFAHRMEMAAATLADMDEAAKGSPVWYQLSLDIGLAQQRDASALREIYDEGIAKFPDYRTLDARMLRILMPRWGGSYRKVDQLVVDAASRDTLLDTAKYALLYWQYDALEQDDIDIFSDAKAQWPLMKEGFSKLLSRYQDSDTLVNAFARFACISGDSEQYRALRPQLESRFSSTVWTAKVSREQCDKKLGAMPSAAN
jgi:hypothetical protein